MHVRQEPDALAGRLAQALPDVRLPAALLARLSGLLAGEQVLLVSADLRPLGFGAYGGQLCLVTPTRVLLATGTETTGPDAAFGVEHWERQVAPVPRSLRWRPAPPAPRRG